MKRLSTVLLLFVCVAMTTAVAQNAAKAPAKAKAPATEAQGKNDVEFPYTPSLDLKAMDKSIDPCVDFYQYSCGGWQKSNPIPPDQIAWSVYGKLYQDNLNFLRGKI